MMTRVRHTHQFGLDDLVPGPCHSATGSIKPAAATGGIHEERMVEGRILRADERPFEIFFLLL